MAETFNRVGTTLSTTNATQIYAAPNAAAGNRSVVLSIMLANITSSVATATVSIRNSGGTTIATLLQSASLPGNTSLDVVVNKLVLLNGDTIFVQAGTANAYSVSISALEIT